MQRLFIASIVVMLGPFGWGTSGFGQEVPMPRRELRVVDKQQWVSGIIGTFVGFLISQGLTYYTLVLGLPLLAWGQQMPSTLKKVSAVVSMDVKDQRGEIVGTIANLMINVNDGSIAYTVIETDLAKKFLAIPWNALTLSSDEKTLTLNMDREKLQTAPSFDQDQWSGTVQRQWLANVYDFYGVSPYPGLTEITAEEIRVARASTLIGMDTKSPQGEDLGEIEELMVDLKQGRITSAVLSIGGLLGIGAKRVAVPWDQVKPATDEQAFIIGITKEELQQAPSWERPPPERERIPEFPWPPPKASATTGIPSALVKKPNNERTSVGDVAQKLGEALQACGYYGTSYYAVPGGFAMVTRLEQIYPDGTPKEMPDRWATKVEPLRSFSLSAYLRALFTANPGYYRIIVFIVTPHPFRQADIPVSRDEAMGWLHSGLNQLPDEIGAQEYSKKHTLTALIYEFERFEVENKSEMRVPGRLPGEIHLEKAKLQAALER